MKLKRAWIWINTDDRAMLVRGWDSGRGLALTPRIRPFSRELEQGCWRVTHTPSGSACDKTHGLGANRKEAEVTLRKLLPLTNWFNARPEKRSKALGRKVKKTLGR